MNCPNCSQPLDPGAAFCGNCGTPIGDNKEASAIERNLSELHKSSVAGNLTPVVAGGVPSYAVALPLQHAGETKAMLSLIFGIIGLFGCYFMALLGLVFGIAGIVLGTMSRRSTKKGFSTAGLIVSSLAVLVALATWVYFISHDPRLNPAKTSANTTQHSLPGTFTAANSLSTPCYSVGFTSKLNISSNSGSCDMAAFNGASMEASSELYKVYAEMVTSEASFSSRVKSAIESDVQTNLPGYKIKSEEAGQFANSTAYIVDAANSTDDTEVVEAAVYHPTTNGDNLFVLVHAVAGGGSASLNDLESEWQWK